MYVEACRRDQGCIAERKKESSTIERTPSDFVQLVPLNSNKVGCAERAISKLTLVPRRKPSLAHTPCAKLSSSAFLIVEESEEKENRGERAVFTLESRSRHRGSVQASPCDPSRRPCFLAQASGLLTWWEAFSQYVHGNTAVTATSECPWDEVRAGSARVEARKIPAGSSTSADG